MRTPRVKHSGWRSWNASELSESELKRKRAEAKAKGKANAEATAGTRPARVADVNERALSALVRLGFGRAQVVHVLSALGAESVESGGQDVAGLVRAALVQLTPQLACA